MNLNTNKTRHKKIKSAYVCKLSVKNGTIEATNQPTNKGLSVATWNRPCGFFLHFYSTLWPIKIHSEAFYHLALHWYVILLNVNVLFFIQSVISLVGLYQEKAHLINIPGLGTIRWSFMSRMAKIQNQRHIHELLHQSQRLLLQIIEIRHD